MLDAQDAEAEILAISSSIFALWTTSAASAMKDMVGESRPPAHFADAARALHLLRNGVPDACYINWRQRRLRSLEAA